MGAGGVRECCKVHGKTTKLLLYGGGVSVGLCYWGWGTSSVSAQVLDQGTDLVLKLLVVGPHIHVHRDASVLDGDNPPGIDGMEVGDLLHSILDILASLLDDLICDALAMQLQQLDVHHVTDGLAIELLQGLVRLRTFKLTIKVCMAMVCMGMWCSCMHIHMFIPMHIPMHAHV